MTNTGFLLQPGSNGVDPDWFKTTNDTDDDAFNYLHGGDEIDDYLSEMSRHPLGQRVMKAASESVAIRRQQGLSIGV